jgi:hypothetical protein
MSGSRNDHVITRKPEIAGHQSLIFIALTVHLELKEGIRTELNTYNASEMKL